MTISPIESAETDAMFASLLEERAINGSENDELAWEEFQDQVEIERFRRMAAHHVLTFPMTAAAEAYFERQLAAPRVSTPRLDSLLSRGCPFSN